VNVSGPVRGWGRPAAIYAAATALSFPILEILVSGTKARDFAHDVFDDGAVTRLGAMRFDLASFGPVLWNSHLMSGNVYFGQFNATPLALDAPLALLATPFLAYATCMALMAFLAGLSMHLFLEESVGLPRLAALGGGLVYIFGFRHYAFGFSAILLPLLLWLSDRVEASPASRRRRLVPLTLCAAFLLYNFSPQPAVLTGAFHLAYCFVASRNGAERRSRVLAWAASWALAFALYAPALFNLLRLLPDSERSIRSNLASVPSLPAAVRLWLQFYAEILVGRPVVSALGANLREAADGTWYVGFLGLGILAFSARIRRETRRERAIGWLLLLLPVLDLVSLALIPAQKHFGVLRTFELNRVRVYVPFALAAAVGVALGALVRARRDSDRDRRYRGAVCAAGALVFLAGALACSRSAAYVVRRIGFWPADPISRERVVAWVGATLYFGLACLVALWFLRASRRRGPGLFSRAALLGLLGMLVFERMAYSRVERAVEDRTLGSWEEALGQTPAIRFLLAQPNPGSQRVMTLGDHSKPNHRDHPNRMMFVGLFCADGYQDVYPLRYHEVFGLLTKPHLDKDPFRHAYFHNWGQRAYAFGPELNSALASLMGVHWLYVRGVPFSDPQWRLVFEQGDERVYENPEAFPRGFLVGQVDRFATRQAVLGAMEAASLGSLRKVAFVEGGVPAAASGSDFEAGTAETTLTVDTPDRVAFRVRSPAPATLVMTDAYVPGWKVTVEGVRREIFPVDNCFRGVSVPAGQSEVLFSYQPAYTRAGAFVAAGGLAILGLLVLPARARTGAPGIHRAEEVAKEDPRP
jgi:hypothetical protein